jgi:hypothetical protein
MHLSHCNTVSTTVVADSVLVCLLQNNNHQALNKSMNKIVITNFLSTPGLLFGVFLSNSAALEQLVQ